MRTMHIEHRKKIVVVVRTATTKDVDGILDLEQETWPFFPANRDKVTSRLEVFPEGNFVAVLEDGDIVGYLSLQFISYDMEKHPAKNWNEVTDNGLIRESHEFNGEYMFGVGMSVSPRCQNMGIATRLIFAGWALIVRYNKRGCLLGSRMPEYSKHRDAYSPEDYIQLRRTDGKLFDPELRLYEGDGFRQVCLIPDYEHDPPSCDYGVLIYQPNPFHNKGGNLFRCLVSWLLARWGHKFLGV